MIRCVVFDFDGTLRQSVAIKHEAYFAAVRDIERGEELFREIIREFPTMTRYSGCALFAERARDLGIDCPDGEELAERYTRACEDAIAACPEVPGSTAFLDWLQARPVYCFVVSGTPQTPLRETVKRLDLEDRFVDVLGDPVSKPEHYTNILARTGLPATALLAVGDGDDDKAAAEAVGGRFVRVRGGAEQSQTNECAVDALDEITSISDLEFPDA